MKKKKFIIAACFATITLASCGGSEEKKTPIEGLTDLIEMSQQYQKEKVEEPKEEAEKEEVEVSEEASISTDEWNEFLASYERYVDSYVAIIKKQKVDPSDMSIMTEYQAMILEGTKWSTKMTEISPDLEFSQLMQMQKIQMKIATAAL